MFFKSHRIASIALLHFRFTFTLLSLKHKFKRKKEILPTIHIYRESINELRISISFMSISNWKVTAINYWYSICIWNNNKDKKNKNILFYLSICLMSAWMSVSRIEVVFFLFVFLFFCFFEVNHLKMYWCAHHLFRHQNKHVESFSYSIIQNSRYSNGKKVNEP